MCSCPSSTEIPAQTTVCGSVAWSPSFRQKDYDHTIQPSDEREVPAESPTSTDVVDAALQVRKASLIIVNGLADKPLWVVRAHCKCPLKMIEKLNERYASSTLSTRMSLMWQLNGLSYQKGKDMGEFVDSFASILDRLECMGAKIDEDLSVVMLLVSMNGHFECTVEAIKTLGDRSSCGTTYVQDSSRSPKRPGTSVAMSR
jgi:hypothetical protein